MKKNILKRLVPLMLVLMLVVGIVPLTAEAYQQTYGGYTVIANSVSKEGLNFALTIDYIYVYGVSSDKDNISLDVSLSFVDINSGTPSQAIKRVTLTVPNKSCLEAYSDTRVHTFGGVYSVNVTVTRPAQSAHTGKATCVSAADCQVCGERISEIDPNAHVWGDWQHDGTSHSRICSLNEEHIQQCVGELTYRRGSDIYHMVEECSICDHSATATRSTLTYEHTYTGNPIVPGTVTFSDNWQGSREIYCVNNVNAGSGILFRMPYFGDYFFKINPAVLTITADSKTIAYGETSPEFTVSYDGFKGSDSSDVISGNIIYTCEYEPGDPSGTYEIVPDGALHAQNYTFNFVSGTLTVEEPEHVHEWGKWTPDTRDTHTRTCLGDASHTETAAHNHVFVGYKDNSATFHVGVYKCSDCGQELHKTGGGYTHTYSAATCQEPAACTLCGRKNGEPDPDAHNYTPVVTAPTCTEDGYTTYTCPCGDSYVDDHVDAIGHDWGEWVSNGNNLHSRACANDSSHFQTKSCFGGTATCTEKAVCTDCGQPYGEVLGHDWGNWISNGDGTHIRTCANDANHTETGDCSGGTATCTEKAKCSGCSTEFGNLAEHTYGTEWKSDGTSHWHECSCGAKSEVGVHSGGTATCKDKAVCAVCGTTYGQTEPGNHACGTEFKDVKDATCGENGYTGDTYCLGCGELLTKGTVTEATGAHAYGNWKVVNAATTTAKGKEERTCSACGHAESRDIPIISDIPQTGDESNLLLWGAAMLVSVLGMVVLLVESKERRFTR